MALVCNDPINLFRYWINPQALSAPCEWYLRGHVPSADVHIFDYVQKFLATVAIQSPFFFWVARNRPLDIRIKHLFIVTALTHPTANLFFPMYLQGMSLSQGDYISCCFFLSTLIESLYLILLLGRKIFSTLLWIFIANLVSWWLPILLQ